MPRRASDRIFLLLLNLFCAAKLSNCVGSSCIPAVERLDAVMRENTAPGVSTKDGKICELPLSPLLCSIPPSARHWYEYQEGEGIGIQAIEDEPLKPLIYPLVTCSPPPPPPSRHRPKATSH